MLGLERRDCIAGCRALAGELLLPRGDCCSRSSWADFLLLPTTGFAGFSVGTGWGQVHRQADCKAQYFQVGVRCSLHGAIDDNLLFSFSGLTDPFSFGPNRETATSILNTMDILFKRLKITLV